MTKRAIQPLLAVVVLVSTVLFSAAPRRAQEVTFQAPREVSVADHEILVKFKGMGQGQLFVSRVATETTRRYPVEPVATFPTLGIQHWKVRSGQRVSEVLDRLRKDPALEFAEPNYRVYALQRMPNDPRWSDLWGLSRIEMPKAWLKSKGSRNVLIAVLDTGVDYRHRDLAANMWRNPGETANGRDDDGNGITDDIHGVNFCRGQRSADPRDDHGHGTHVAGTIAAEGDNGTDVVGTAWRLQLMAVKFLCEDGSGTIADAIRGIEYALDKGAHVMNNSWGGRGFSGALELAIREADRQGVLFVAAAGNGTNDNDRNPTYPASYRVPNVIAVAATTPEDTLAGFSNWGAASVHLGAPGTAILSTIPDNKLAAFNGTSMATSHVSGCAGLLKAIDPDRRARELRSILLATADLAPGLADRVSRGRLNCGKAAAR